MIGGGRWWGLGLVAGFVLSGCGGGTPAPVPTRVASPIASTPAPVVTASSAGPTGPYPLTKDGAYAIVRDFYAKKNDAIMHRKVSELDTLTTSTCFCRNNDSYIAGLLTNHEHVDGETLRDVRPLSYQASPLAAQVGVSYNADSGKIVTSGGVVAEVDKAAIGLVDVVTLTAVNDQWLVSDIRRIVNGKPA